MDIATAAIEEAPHNSRTLARAGSDDPRSLVRGLSLFAVHASLYVATLIGAVANFPLPVNILFGAANGVFIALMFIIGHDANHMCFVPDRRWNRWRGCLRRFHDGRHDAWRRNRGRHDGWRRSPGRHDGRWRCNHGRHLARKPVPFPLQQLLMPTLQGLQTLPERRMARSPVHFMHDLAMETLQFMPLPC